MRRVERLAPGTSSTSPDRPLSRIEPGGDHRLLPLQVGRPNLVVRPGAVGTVPAAQARARRPHHPSLQTACSPNRSSDKPRPRASASSLRGRRPARRLFTWRTMEPKWVQDRVSKAAQKLVSSGRPAESVLPAVLAMSQASVIRLEQPASCQRAATAGIAPGGKPRVCPPARRTGRRTPARP